MSYIIKLVAAAGLPADPFHEGHGPEGDTRLLPLLLLPAADPGRPARHHQDHPRRDPEEVLCGHEVLSTQHQIYRHSQRCRRDLQVSGPKTKNITCMHEIFFMF